MNRKRKTKEQEDALELRYLDALIELREKIKSNRQFSLSKFFRERKLSNSVNKVLTDGGIIKRTGKHKSPVYEWISPVEPNIHMAKQTISNVRKLTNKYARESAERKAGDAKPLSGAVDNNGLKDSFTKQQEESDSKDESRPASLIPKKGVNKQSVTKATTESSTSKGIDVDVSIFFGLLKISITQNV